MARAPEPDLSTRTRSTHSIGIISARRGTSTPASSFIRCRRGRLDALVHRNRRTSRVSSEAAVPRPGIRDDSAAAPRSNRPVFGRPRANASVASITVDTILSLFADFTVKPVIPTLPPKCLHSQIAHPCYVRGSEPILQGFTLSAPYTYRTTGWERGGGGAPPDLSILDQHSLSPCESISTRAMLHCSLCQQSVPVAETTRCSCGQVLHPGCAADHEPYCPSTGEERWIGVEEF